MQQLPRATIITVINSALSCFFFFYYLRLAAYCFFMYMPQEEIHFLKLLFKNLLLIYTHRNLHSWSMISWYLFKKQPGDFCYCCDIFFFIFYCLNANQNQKKKHVSKIVESETEIRSLINIKCGFGLFWIFFWYMIVVVDVVVVVVGRG